MSSGSDEQSSADEAVLKSASLRKTRKKRNEKRDIRHRAPLKAGLPSPAQGRPRSTIIDEATLLSECEAIYSRLPKTSKYARHKLKVLAKAIELLKRDRAARTAQEADELQQLLGALRLGSNTKGPRKGKAAADAACVPFAAAIAARLEQQQQAAEDAEDNPAAAAAAAAAAAMPS